MIQVRSANPDDKKQWNAIVDHPLQTWEWGEFRKKMGIEVARVVVGKKESIDQCWQITFHKIPFTSFTIGYFPKGPKPDQFMIDELMKLGKQHHAIYIQLEPNIIRLPSSVFGLQQLVKSHHPLFTKYTFVLDLTKSEEQLMKEMHNKTRYNIRLAQKHGVVIKEDTSNQAFESYLALSEETTKRQGFYAHNHAYHHAMWETMQHQGLARLFTATYEGEVLAAWIIFCHKKAMYYPYGASSRNHREVMAPNLLLWELMRWGKQHGFTSFDLWGALGPNPDSNDPWYGFHRFKEGYNPTLVEFVGSYDLVIHPILYKLYCLGDDLRWKVLKIRKAFNF